MTITPTSHDMGSGQTLGISQGHPYPHTPTLLPVPCLSHQDPTLTSEMASEPVED